MADGHLNKCKECTKKDVRNDYDRKSQDEEWLEKERARGREKYQRLDYKTKYENVETIYKGKVNDVSKFIKRRGFDMIGKECHHWNYNDLKSVFILSRSAHRRLHKHLILDEKTGLFTTDSGVLIDSIEKAKAEYKKILEMEKSDTSLMLVDIS